MKVHFPKLYNMAHLLALNVLLLPRDLTIIFICDQASRIDQTGATSPTEQQLSMQKIISMNENFNTDFLNFQGRG